MAPLASSLPRARSVFKSKGNNIFSFVYLLFSFLFFCSYFVRVVLICFCVVLCYDVLFYFVLLCTVLVLFVASSSVIFFEILFCVSVSSVQAERLQLVLGTGKQEAEAKLLWLMFAQKDKYEKWLFRVLVVFSELLVRPTVQQQNLCYRHARIRGRLVVMYLVSRWGQSFTIHLSLS